MPSVRGELNREDPDAGERWVGGLIGDEGLQFIEKDMFEASLAVARRVFVKTSG